MNRDDATVTGDGSVHFGRTAEDYGRHRPPYPEVLFHRLASLGIGAPAQTIADVGTGAGHLALGLGLKGARVVGVDPAEELLQEARQLSLEAGLPIEFRVGAAEATGLPDEAFDVVTAAQCWHWFDGPRAAREAWRILKPGGQVAIVHFDWIPLTGSVVEATEALIRSFNPRWSLGGGDGIHPQRYADLSAGGFERLEGFTLDLAMPYTHEGWRGRIRASAGVGASLSLPRVRAFDETLAGLLKDRFPVEPLTPLHRIFCVVGHKPMGDSVAPGEHPGPCE